MVAKAIDTALSTTKKKKQEQQEGDEQQQHTLWALKQSLAQQ